MRTSELVALDWGDVDWLRGEVRISRAMTQAAKRQAEVTKTTWRAPRSFRTLARWSAGLATADPENNVDTCSEESWCAVPTPLSDQTHLCFDDVVSWRTPNVGCPANGAY